MAGQVRQLSRVGQRSARWARRLRRAAAWLRLRAALAGAPRRVTAMVRVRDEQEFVGPAVRSVADLVDHLVLVDNLSRDGTPAILDRLERAYAGKVDRYAYEHEVGRVGSESLQLAASPDDPRTSAAFYNWCVSRCPTPFVLKWDGDMIATDAFAEALAQWRRSRSLALVFRGVNVHPDRGHLLAAAETDHAVLAAQLPGGGVPKWVAELTHDHLEPRLFPRRFARYEMELGWTQRLSTPALAGGTTKRAPRIVDTSCFLHMKFCKREPLANYSPDLAHLIAANIIEGPPLAAEEMTVLERWGLAAPAEDGAESSP